MAIPLKNDTTLKLISTKAIALFKTRQARSLSVYCNISSQILGFYYQIYRDQVLLIFAEGTTDNQEQMTKQQ